MMNQGFYEFLASKQVLKDNFEAHFHFILHI